MKTDDEMNLDQYVVDLLGPEKALAWWCTSNPMFGGISPAALIRLGRGDNVYAFIREAREGNGDEFQPGESREV